MDVVLHMIWCIMIDDQFELLDVQAASGDGGRDDNRNDTRLEVGNGGVTVYLILATVQRHAQVAFAHELAQEVVGGFLSINEDECP